MSNIRAEFEAWLTGNQGVDEELLERHAIGYYLNETVADSWTAYQAGRLAGQKDMRERAAKVCVDDESGRDSNGYWAELIRELPVEES